MSNLNMERASTLKRKSPSMLICHGSILLTIYAYKGLGGGVSQKMT